MERGWVYSTLTSVCGLLPSPGHGSLCRHDRLCPPAQPQGLLPASLRASNLWCLLGKCLFPWSHCSLLCLIGVRVCLLGWGESRQAKFSALGAKIFFHLQNMQSKKLDDVVFWDFAVKNEEGWCWDQVASSSLCWRRLSIRQVFFSAYIFNSNVMVKVATQPADNPLDVLSRKLHLGPNVGRDVPRLSLPGKLVFPR